MQPWELYLSLGSIVLSKLKFFVNVFALKNFSRGGFLGKSVISSENKHNSPQKGCSSGAACLLGMQETEFSKAEKGCSGTVTRISYVLDNGFVPGLNEIIWHSLSSCADLSSGELWDPGMAHAMGKMTCMGASDKLRYCKGLWRQDTQPFSWAPWKGGPAQVVSDLLC